MRKVALLLAVPAALAYGQSNPPAQAPAQSQPSAPQDAATAEKTVDQTASPELVGQLVNELGITPTQAQGAAGTLFGVAKTKLTAADFAKVASAVPNMEGLLKAAPTAKSSTADLVAGAAAGLGGATNAAAAAGALSKLGLKTETIAKLAPTLVKVVEAKGGAEIGALLAGALK
jgi:hypothetical protein